MGPAHRPEEHEITYLKVEERQSEGYVHWLHKRRWIDHVPVDGHNGVGNGERESESRGNRS